MSLVNWFMVVVLPGGWLIVGLIECYKRFIRRSSHDTSEINFLISNYVMYKNGKRNSPYVGSFIKLTDDVARVSVDSEGNLSRDFIC
jgi:hypothetical protein